MVYVTCPDIQTARQIACSLLDRRLVACANVTKVESLYRYDGETVNEDEVLIVLKTRDELSRRVIDAVEELHPYDVPCVVAYPASGANAAYEEWVEAETANPR